MRSQLVTALPWAGGQGRRYPADPPRGLRALERRDPPLVREDVDEGIDRAPGWGVRPAGSVSSAGKELDDYRVHVSSESWTDTRSAIDARATAAGRRQPMTAARGALLLGVLALAVAGAALVVAFTRDVDGNAGVIRVVRSVSAPADDAVVKEQSASCPHGYVATGGGGSIPDASSGTPGAAIFWSSPDGNGWHVQAHDAFRGNKPWVLTAVVVCA